MLNPQALEIINSDEYQNLLRFYSKEELRKKLEASKLNPTQIKALFEDNFGTFDLAASSIESAYAGNNVRAAEALRAVVNLHKYANFTQKVALNKPFTPVELEEAQKAYTAYVNVCRSAPPAAKEALTQLKRIVLNSDVELPVASHMSVDTLRAYYQAHGHTYRGKGKPQVEAIIGGCGSHDQEAVNEVQNFALDYLNRHANQLDPANANNNHRAEISPIIDLPPDQRVHPAVQTPTPAAVQRIPEVRIVRPQPTPSSRREPELRIIQSDTDRLTKAAIELAVAMSAAESVIAAHHRAGLQAPVEAYTLFISLHTSPEAIAIKRHQAALIASFEQSLIAALPILLHQNFTFFSQSTNAQRPNNSQQQNLRAATFAQEQTIAAHDLLNDNDARVRKAEEMQLDSESLADMLQNALRPR